MNKHTILFLAANPSGTDLRALDLEARSIGVELKRTGYRDRFEFETRWAAEPLDLLRALRELRPTVVHFSGRGGRDGLLFQNLEGGARAVSAGAIAEAFGAAGGSVRLVVLSACYGDAAAEALLAHVDCIIGTSGALHEAAARSFAIGFYGALGDQESVATAYQHGNAAISLEGLADAERPQLRVRAGCDAAGLIAAVAPAELVELPCPYPGMRPYSADDAAHFYGRTAEVDELIGQLRAGEREIYVIGPSASGKSSIIAAGLLPQLLRARSGLRPFVPRLMRPGEHPTARLREVLEAPDGELAAAIGRLLEHRARGASVLLVLDQLEELFTLASAEEREAFLPSLRALRAEPRCVIISTLRADFLETCMKSPLWPERRGRFAHIHVVPLRDEALREPIECPAQDLGVLVEPGLVQQLLAHAGSEPGALPLLQEVLIQLWDRRRGPTLALADYQALGGRDRTGFAVARAIAVERDQVAVRLRDRLSHLSLSPLVRPNRARAGPPIRTGYHPARTMAAYDDENEFEYQRREVLVNRAALLNRLDQLLTEDGGDRWVVVTGGTRADRRALLGAWLARLEAAGESVPYLSFCEENWGEDLAELVGSLVAQIEQRFGLGEPDESAGASPGERLVYSWERLESTLSRVSARVLAPGGERLIILIDGLDEHDAAVGALLNTSLRRALPRGVSFLCSCRRRSLLVNELAANGGKLVRIDLNDVLSLSFSADWPVDGDSMVLRLDLSSAFDRFLGHAMLHGEVSVGLGFLCAAQEALSLEVLGELARWGPEQKKSFRQSARTFLLEEPAAWNGAEAYGLRPDIAEQVDAVALHIFHRWLSQRLATWPPLVGAAERRYALRHALFHRLEGGDWVDAWRLAADLGFLEARCRELGLEELQADVARAAERCRESNNEALCQRFEDLARAIAREAPRLRVAPEAAAALVWNRLRRFGWSEDELDTQLRVSADAAFLRLRHWAAREGPAPPGEAVGHTRRVSACAATPDGWCAVSASYDRTLKVWDVENGRVLATLDEHAGWVNECAVTPDGRRAISASEDGTLKVWDLERGRALITLQGHVGAVRACTVMPDARRVISVSDGALKVWDLEDGRVLETLEGYTGWVRSCAVTPDARRVVLGSYDGTLKIWDLGGGRSLATLEGHTRGVRACAVTPDGRRVISASEDGTLKVWDLEGGRVLATLESHAEEVHACAVTPDGRRVVSASADRALVLNRR